MDSFERGQLVIECRAAEPGRIHIPLLQRNKGFVKSALARQSHITQRNTLLL
ncbi:hypothetical protein D3C81_2335550 [compost metagenome]